jgi:hypothetical protein
VLIVVRGLKGSSIVKKVGTSVASGTGDSRLSAAARPSLPT